MFWAVNKGFFFNCSPGFSLVALDKKSGATASIPQPFSRKLFIELFETEKD
jgi:hypothetical protein